MNKIFIFIIMSFLLIGTTQAQWDRSRRGNAATVKHSNIYVDDIYENTSGHTITLNSDVTALGSFILTLSATEALAVTGKITVTDSVRNEGTLRQKGQATFGTTGTTAIIGTDGKITASDTLVSLKGVRSEGNLIINGAAGIKTATPGATLEVKGAYSGSVSTDTLLSVYNDRYGAAPRDSSFVVLPTGGAAVSVTGANVGISIDGNKTSGNLFQAINDDDGAVGDSSVTISTTGKLNAHAGVQIGNSAVVDGQDKDLVFSGDADSDGSQTTTESATISLTGASTPTNAYWGFTSTQSKGWYFDNRMGVASAPDGGYTFYSGGSIGAYSNIVTAGGNTTSTTPLTVNTVTATTVPIVKVDANKSSGNIIEWSNDNTYSAIGDSAGYINSVGDLVMKGATKTLRVVSLADGAQYLLPTGVSGFGQVKATGAWCFFHFAVDGTVTLEDHVSGSITEDNDTTLNVFDDGSGIGIENELGSTLNVLIDITYYTP